LATVGAIESGLKNCNYSFETGSGLKACQELLNENNFHY